MVVQEIFEKGDIEMQAVLADETGHHRRFEF